MADVLVVDKDTRSVKVPDGFVLGVESDEDTNKVIIKVPRWVGNESDIDLSLFTLQIVYMNASNIKGTYSVANVSAWSEEDDAAYPEVQSEGQYLKVIWKLSRLATLTKGATYFVLCAITRNSGGALTNEWNTEICGLTVKGGLEISDADITNEAESVINQLLAQMSSFVADAGRSANEADASALTAATQANIAKNSAKAAQLSETNAKESENTVTAIRATIDEAVASANSAATNAQNVANTVQTKLDNGELKGEKGDKGDDGATITDASNLPVNTFDTVADEYPVLNAGEMFKTLWGKSVKFLDDLKTKVTSLETSKADASDVTTLKEKVGTDELTTTDTNLSGAVNEVKAATDTNASAITKLNSDLEPVNEKLKTCPISTKITQVEYDAYGVNGSPAISFYIPENKKWYKCTIDGSVDT